MKRKASFRQLEKIKTLKYLILEPTTGGRLAVLPSEVKSPDLMPQQAFRKAFLLDHLLYFLSHWQLALPDSLCSASVYSGAPRKSKRPVSLFSEAKILGPAEWPFTRSPTAEQSVRLV